MSASPIKAISTGVDNAAMMYPPLALQASGGDSAITYSASTLVRQLLDAVFVSGGRVTPTAFVVSQRAAGVNFSVDISSGYEIIVGTSSANQGKYLVHLSTAMNLPLPTAPISGATRVHRIYAQMLDKTDGVGTEYGWQLDYLEDTGSGTPAIPANAASLATVSIAVGQGSVADSNITNNNQLAATSNAFPNVKMYYATDGPSGPDSWTETNHYLMGTTWPDPGWPYYIRFQGQAEIGSDSGTRYDLWGAYTTASGTITGAATTGEDGATVFTRHTGVETTPQTGGKTFVFAAIKAYGSGSGHITPYNWQFVVELVRAS